MAEAEVSLRLAFWLFDQNRVNTPIKVAIDGAQVKTGEIVHFDLPNFLRSCGWQKLGDADPWQSEYVQPGSLRRIIIHSNPGCGDVVARLRSGHLLRVECKKGPLIQTQSSSEYPLMREALGQLLTVKEVGDQDILAAAVPHSPKFEKLAIRWREAPLVKRFGIRILTVNQSGSVFGFEPESTAAPPNEAEMLHEVIETFRIFCSVVLLSFGQHGQDLRETIARNFIARGMSCTLNIFAVWQSGSEQDAWILHRSLLDRLFHLHHLIETDGFSDFDEYSFISEYKARQSLMSDPDMSSKISSTLKELQGSEQSAPRLTRCQAVAPMAQA